MRITSLIATGIMYACRVFPINRRKIVFSSFFGTKYNDSPRAISEAMAGSNDVEVVWILNDGIAHPANVRTVRPKSIRSIFELATAKVWVDNSRKMTYVRKRKKQFYVQTWHGGVALKMVEADAADTLNEQYVMAAKNDSRMADLFISECEWRTMNYRNAFWYDGEILKSGLPRSVVFFQNKRTVSEKVRKALKIGDHQRLALYAPTFRDKDRMDAYSLDYDQLLTNLQKKFGGDWCVIVRLHPNAAKQVLDIPYSDRIIQGTEYSDINELMMASEVLISDYSGCIFDGLHLGLKVFLYASDLQAYLDKERRLYFTLTDLPAKLAQSNLELANQIETFDEATYEQERSAFLERMGYYPAEHATEQITKRIFEVMQKE